MKVACIVTERVCTVMLRKLLKSDSQFCGF